MAGVLAVCMWLLIAGRYPHAAGGGRSSSATHTSLPTVGGTAPDITYPPTKSKATCFQLNPTDSNADVLGETLGTSFYCVVENVCVNDQQFMLFDDALAGHEFDFPRQPLLQHPFTVVLKETENAEFLDAQRNGRYYDDGDGDAGDSAVTAIVKHAYCCGHIGHFMEPIPTLQHALRDLEKNATRRQLAGIASGRVTVTRGAIAKASSLSGGLSPWNEFMLHAAVGGPARPDFKFAKGLLQLHDATTRCFRRAVIAGATYQFFQSPEMADGFRDAIWARLEHVKRTEASKPKADPILLTAGGASGFVHDPKKRVILYAQRDAKRAVSDADNMEMILQAAASLVNATVKTIKFGDHPFAVQAAHAQEADVMIGLHGADLTNLVFQRKGAVVIEMNPLFFFEPRFREMTQHLGVHYNAWTCTAPTCAFGGNRMRWSRVIGAMEDLSYEPKSRKLSVPGYEPWVWPYKGYAASCPQCDKSSCCTPLANAFYSALRDDNVRVGEHAAEIAEVLIEGFQSLGWIPTDVSARALAETAVAP